MKTILAPFLALASGLGLGGLFQDPKPKPTADAAVAQDPLQPGPQHTMLLKTVGNWDAVVITTDDKGTEQRAKGTMTRRKQTAFHVVEDYQGEFMHMPFVGHGVEGYCPVRKQFFTFWVDSMTPSPMTVHGDYDAKTGELTQLGECYGMSGKLEKCRTVTKFVDDDHMQWAMFGPGPDGKEMEHLRIEYTRKK